jgi:hypothetical protein
LTFTISQSDVERADILSQRCSSKGENRCPLLTNHPGAYSVLALGFLHELRCGSDVPLWFIAGFADP